MLWEQPLFVSHPRTNLSALSTIMLHSSLRRWCWELSCHQLEVGTYDCSSVRRMPWSCLRDLFRRLDLSSAKLRTRPCLLLSRLFPCLLTFVQVRLHRKICRVFRPSDTCRVIEEDDSCCLYQMFFPMLLFNLHKLSRTFGIEVQCFRIWSWRTFRESSLMNLERK